MEEQPFSSADLERRRAASRRLGWLIGAFNLAPSFSTRRKAVLSFFLGLFPLFQLFF